ARRSSDLVCPPHARQRDAWVLWRSVGENARRHRRGVAGRCAGSESDPDAGLSPLLSACPLMQLVYPHELLAYPHELLACLLLSAHWDDWRAGWAESGASCCTRSGPRAPCVAGPRAAAASCPDRDSAETPCADGADVAPWEPKPHPSPASPGATGR